MGVNLFNFTTNRVNNTRVRKKMLKIEIILLQLPTLIEHPLVSNSDQTRVRQKRFIHNDTVIIIVIATRPGVAPFSFYKYNNTRCVPFV